jgi:hypothetical protein
MHINNVLTFALTLHYTEQIFSHKNGEIMRSILSFDQNKRSLELQPMERSYLGFLTHAAQVEIVPVPLLIDVGFVLSLLCVAFLICFDLIEFD